MSSTANANPINESEILPVPNALLGIDVSHYQGVVQWDLVAEAGVKFAWIKATDGVGVDPKLEKNIAGAGGVPIPFGLYHFWRPGVSADAQAKKFLNTIRGATAKVAPNRDLCWMEFATALDIEVGSLTEENQTDALSFLEALSAPQLQGGANGLKPFVYVSPSYAQINLTDPAWLQYPLWTAHYTDLPQPNIGKWPKWTFWQRQPFAMIPGISVPVDVDWFNGNADDFQAMLALPSGVVSA